MADDSRDRKKAQGKTSPLNCFFWVRDQFLPETECTSAQANVLSMMASYGNPDGTRVRPGNPNLLATTKLSESELKRVIKFWRKHPSGVLQLVSQGNGAGNASEFRIVMFESKGVPLEPFDAEERGSPRTPLEAEGVPKGVHSEQKRGSKRGSPRTPTEPPESFTEIPKSSSLESDDDLKFEKAKTDFLAKASGPNDELAEALNMIRDRSRDNGNQPVRNWKAYFTECLANFLDSDWKTVRDRLARAAKAHSLNSDEAKARAKLLYNTARDHGWNDREFGNLLHHDFGQPIQPTVPSIAQLSEWDYQAALTRFQQPPETICRECGQRGCEHLRAERERFLAELRQRFRG